jgi:hypothetical protein
MYKQVKVRDNHNGEDGYLFLKSLPFERKYVFNGEMANQNPLTLQRLTLFSFCPRTKQEHDSTK